MRQYGDIPFTIPAEDVHFTTAREIHVIFSQPTYALDLTGDRIEVLDDNNLQGKITQKESQNFALDPRGENTEIQVTYLDANGERHDSNISKVIVDKNLLKQVIPDE